MGIRRAEFQAPPCSRLPADAAPSPWRTQRGGGEGRSTNVASTYTKAYTFCSFSADFDRLARFRHLRPRNSVPFCSSRVRLKIPFRKECGFDSHRPHHLRSAGSGKPTARRQEPASADRLEPHDPRSAARNDNRTALSCWHLAARPGCSHRHKSTARSDKCVFVDRLAIALSIMFDLYRD
jgi:hypothetical protein